ncbi:hypothetical protein J2798_003808 [Herbaspirillum seropedicae]|nr:hypothetical protein [Herbaspirillum seropedicae]
MTKRKKEVEVPKQKAVIVAIAMRQSPLFGFCPGHLAAA